MTEKQSAELLEHGSVKKLRPFFIYRSKHNSYICIDNAESAILAGILYSQPSENCCTKFINNTALNIILLMLRSSYMHSEYTLSTL